LKKTTVVFYSVFFSIITLLAAGCAGDSSDGGQYGAVDDSLIAPGRFSGGTTQQLSLSSPIANWTWNDPHVIKVGSQYVMYASATDNFNYPVKAYRLVSDDGATWTADPVAPVLTPTASWDAGAIETPAVVRFNGQYHLFWTGYPVHADDPGFDVKMMRVGHAVSNDGVVFVPDALNPVVSPSGAADDGNASNDWYAFVTAEPAPVVHNGMIYLYFTALGADTGTDLDMGPGASLQVIGLVTSADGHSWSAPTRVLRPNQAIYPRKPGGDGSYWAGYSTPNAIVINDRVHLFFDVARGYAVAPAPYAETWIQERLHHARSVDGVSGWIEDSGPIASRDGFPWTTREIRSPSALLDGTTLRLYFAGDSLYTTNQFGIGMMTCDLKAE